MISSRILNVLFLVALPYLLLGQTVYQVGSDKQPIEPSSSIFSVALAGYGAPRDGRFSLEWIKVDNESIPFKIFDKDEQAGKRAERSEIQPVDFAVYKNKVYGLTGNNELLRYQGHGEWLRIAIQNGITYTQDIVKIGVHKDRLYGLDASGTVFIAQHKTDNNLFSHALSIESNKEHVLLISLDLCGFDYAFINQVKAAISKKHKIPASAILINASHTHFAPVSQNWFTWGEHCQRPNPEYMEAVVKPAIITSVKNAIKSAKSATISFGRGQVEIGSNRRFPDGPYDRDVDVIKIAYQGQHTNNILFMHGCHPVFQNAGEEGVTLSANYPAVARDLINRKSGGESMFIQGTAGDVNPIDSDHRLSGEKLANAVLDVLDNQLMEISGEIDYHLDSVNFPVKAWSVDALEKFKKENSGKEGDVGAEKNVRWADLMLKHHREGTMPESMPVYIQTINIGNWKLVGLSREVVSEYGLGIKALYPDKIVSVAGYTNDVASYLPTIRHIKAGVYEGDESFFWYGQANIFPDNVYDQIISAVKANNR